MNMVCKCGGKEFFTEEHGNQTGLYCSACGKWQKWLKKDEIRLFNHGIKVENASLLERLNTSAVVTPRLRRPSTLPLTLLVWLSKSSADVSRKRSEVLIRR